MKEPNIKLFAEMHQCEGNSRETTVTRRMTDWMPLCMEYVYYIIVKPGNQDL